MRYVVRPALAGGWTWELYDQGGQLVGESQERPYDSRSLAFVAAMVWLDLQEAEAVAGDPARPCPFAAEPAAA